MKIDIDGKPKLDQSSLSLHVRERDVNPEIHGAGHAGPGGGGLSVGPSVKCLNALMVPKKHGGQNTNAKVDVWRLSDGLFEDSPVGRAVVLRLDKWRDGVAVHGVIEPDAVVTLDRFRALAALTRNDWAILEEGNRQ